MKLMMESPGHELHEEKEQEQQSSEVVPQLPRKESSPGAFGSLCLARRSRRVTIVGSSQNHRGALSSACTARIGVDDDFVAPEAADQRSRHGAAVKTIRTKHHVWRNVG